MHINLHGSQLFSNPAMLYVGITCIHRYMYVLYICITYLLDFGLLKSNYEKILKCLPKDIHQSVQKLEDKLSAAQMCSIIECSIPHIANKMILDCLIEKMNCKEDLLDLCDQLDRLSDISPDLKQLINKLRIGCYTYYVHMYLHNYLFQMTTVCTIWCKALTEQNSNK